MECSGLTFASVDIIETESATLVLEINSGVALDNFAQSSLENFQIAKNIYQIAINKMLNE